MMETMQTPETRAEFERRLHLLRERLRQGKILFSKDIKHLPLGLENVRYLPNGRIDLLSINESVRLQANMMIQFESESFKAMTGHRESQNVPEDCPSEHTGEAPAE